jgi:prepilin-type N-terminal cleavage/methylation domain-containing protein
VPASASRRRPRPAAPPSDGGFSLIEVLVSTALIGIIMAALATFFVNTLSATSRQAGAQVGNQVAADGMERVRALRGAEIANDRDKNSSDIQWGSPVAGAAAYLTGMTEVWDGSATGGAGASAALPTSPRTVQLNGVAYLQNFYVGTCWQPASGGDCGTTQDPRSVQFYRVVVAVTWPDTHCTAGTCSTVSATLVSSNPADPIFNSNDVAQAPAVQNPGNQVGEVTVAVSLQLGASGGAPPVIWAASGLPPGLTMGSDGLIAGTPTTAGSYAVTVSATDAFTLVGTAAFGWTVNPALTAANPGTQTLGGATPYSLALTATAGVTPLTWAVTAPGGWGATGLPPGLSLDAVTGVISGTATATGSHPVTVTATDALGAHSPVTFTMTVPVVAIQTPAAQSGEVGAPVNTGVTASYGVAPYTWSATGLPAGLSISPSTGVISGSPTTVGSNSVRVTVTDATGVNAKTAAYAWTIAAGPGITGPTGPVSTSIATTYTTTATVSAGTAPYTWSAIGLPTGLTMSTAGVISGKPTAGTRFVATLTVTDALGSVTSSTVVFTASGATLNATSPNGDRSDKANKAISSVTAAASGGSTPYGWTATGLPPGLSISPTTGVITGTPTLSGTYVVTLTVTDANSPVRKAVTMFVWTIQ